MAAATSGWGLRLHELFGARFQDVTEDQLRGLVDGRVREDADLDFKQDRYGSSDSQKRELSADIAAMANDRGGVIVIGIRDEDDVAAELTPVDPADGEEGRLRQTAAGNLAPHVSFDVHQVNSAKAPGKAYYLLVVPPSSLRPHAVRKDIDLRYPCRNGSTTRWLSEAEVADRYRDRLAAFREEGARAEAALDEGLSEMDLDDDASYLAMALVPSARGSMAIDLARLRELEEWAIEPTAAVGWRGFFGSRPNARTGARRVRLGSLLSSRRPVSDYAELHTDGTGVACARVSWRRNDSPEAPGASLIGDEALLWEVSRCLRLVGRHAVENAGAWGDAAVVARVVGRAMQLTYPIHGGLFDETYDSRLLDGPIESRHTVPLESIAGSDRELLASTRVLATDLFNALGAAEVRQIDQLGRLRAQYVRDKGVVALAARLRIELVDDVV